MSPGEEYHRRNDTTIAALVQRISDLIERYDRDCGAMGEWRRTVDATLKEQSIILTEISPAYNRGKWIVGLIMVGSIGIAIKGFWQHIAWK